MTRCIPIVRALRRCLSTGRPPAARVAAGGALAAWLGAGATGLAGLAGCGNTTSDRDVIEIGYSELAGWMERDRDDVLLIDARRPEVFAAGTIPGAVNRSLEDLNRETDFDVFAPYRLVVVFGEDPSSVRGLTTTKRLVRFGVDDVYFFEGGYREWVSRREP